MGRPAAGRSDEIVADAVAREFQELGLTINEAKVLVALLRLGRANTNQLAHVSGVARTAIYQVLEALNTRHLALRVPGATPAEWTTLGRDEVLARIQEGEEAAFADRMAAFRKRTSRLAEVLSESFPDNPAAALPYVHFVHGAAQAKRAYDALLSQAQTELLMYTRPPYSYTLGKPNPAVMDLLARGVAARALYQAKEWAEPSAEGFRAEMELYHQAGVAARVVDDLPMKLVVVDRATALLSMPDPVLGDEGFPTTLLVEHPAFAGTLARGFEHLWAEARPLPAVSSDNRPGQSSADEETQRAGRVRRQSTTHRGREQPSSESVS